MSDGRLEAVQTRFDEAARWLAVERGPLTVVCLVSERAQRVPVRAGAQAILLASDDSIQVAKRRRNDAARLGLRLGDSFLT